MTAASSAFHGPPLAAATITAAYAGSHYATWPVALCRKLINLMCPRQVCTVCGEPRRRITAPSEEYTAARGGSGDFSRHQRGASDLAEGNAARGNTSGFTAQHETLGWTDCGCAVGELPNLEEPWRRGIVCDPFCGSGTTLQAASELGRDSIGIDLDRRNLELARQRLGMFLVESEDEVPA